MEKYSAEYRLGGREEKVTEHDLRRIFYKNGVTYTFEKKNRKGEVIERIPVHFKMLMRSTGRQNRANVYLLGTVYTIRQLISLQWDSMT